MSPDINEEFAPQSTEEGTPETTLIIGEESPIRISSGHRIQHHEGKCSRPHGHNYEITIEITGTLRKEEKWVIDKGIVTSIIDEWDHMFLIEEGDPLISGFKQSGDEDSLVILPCPPTAEAMAAILAQKIKEGFQKNISNVEVTVRETNELCATRDV